MINVFNVLLKEDFVTLLSLSVKLLWNLLAGILPLIQMLV